MRKDVEIILEIILESTLRLFYLGYLVLCKKGEIGFTLWD